MHAIPGSSSSLSLAQTAALKKDVASQTECNHQVPTTTGRAVNRTPPIQSVCPDIGTGNIVTSTDESLSEYGVDFVKGTLQAGLQGGNKLIRSVAGLTSQPVPFINQGLLVLTTMPALVGAYPAYGFGSNEAGTPLTSSSVHPTTNLNTTSDPDSNSNAGSVALGIMFGSYAVAAVMGCAYLYCRGVYSSCKQLKRDNPEALNRHALQAALKDPWYGHGAEYRQPSDRTRLPIPAQRPPAPTAPTTCEQGT
ncbi:hypothetical protein, partial [Endozoicomonas sp. SESOKO1]|uniref:hypothetical protein n=1 Tax=Endozoicomonas sp. SESOKO1 TaxID=2828742 RepID=UPI00214872EF